MAWSVWPVAPRPAHRVADDDRRRRPRPARAAATAARAPTRPGPAAAAAPCPARCRSRRPRRRPAPGRAGSRRCGSAAPGDHAHGLGRDRLLAVDPHDPALGLGHHLGRDDDDVAVGQREVLAGQRRDARSAGEVVAGRDLGQRRPAPRPAATARHGRSRAGEPGRRARPPAAEPRRHPRPRLDVRHQQRDRAAGDAGGLDRRRPRRRRPCRPASRRAGRRRPRRAVVQRHRLGGASRRRWRRAPCRPCRAPVRRRRSARARRPARRRRPAPRGCPGRPARCRCSRPGWTAAAARRRRRRSPRAPRARAVAVSAPTDTISCAVGLGVQPHPVLLEVHRPPAAGRLRRRR